MGVINLNKNSRVIRELENNAKKHPKKFKLEQDKYLDIINFKSVFIHIKKPFKFYNQKKDYLFKDLDLFQFFIVIVYSFYTKERLKSHYYYNEIIQIFDFINNPSQNIIKEKKEFSKIPDYRTGILKEYYTIHINQELSFLFNLLDSFNIFKVKYEDILILEDELFILNDIFCKLYKSKDQHSFYNYSFYNIYTEIKNMELFDKKEIIYSEYLFLSNDKTKLFVELLQKNYSHFNSVSQF